MEITFLGPGGGRYTTAKQPKGYGTGGFLIENNSYTIWVDPGPGAVVRYNLYAYGKEVDAVYVSHAHLDHAGDINAVAELVNEFGKKRKAELFIPENMKNGCEILTNYHKQLFKKINILQDGKSFIAGNDRLIPIKTKHNIESYGFLYKKLSYSSDSGCFDGLKKLKAKVFIGNFVQPTRSPYHLSIECIEKVIEYVNPSLIIINHITLSIHEMIVKKTLDKYIKPVEEKGIEVVVAKEGLTIEI